MSLTKFDLPTKTIKKKVTRKLSFTSDQSRAFSDLRKRTVDKTDVVSDAGSGFQSENDDLYSSARIRDDVKGRYNVDLEQLTHHLEKELSSSVEQDSSCWTAESILNLIDGLRVPLELLVKIIQAVKSTIK